MAVIVLHLLTVIEVNIVIKIAFVFVINYVNLQNLEQKG